VRKNKTSRTGITKKRKETKTLRDKWPDDQGEWLELAIRFTERALRTNGTTGVGSLPSSHYLVRQTSRLKTELEQWRKENE
jgi:hypothetical protein